MNTLAMRYIVDPVKRCNRVRQLLGSSKHGGIGRTTMLVIATNARMNVMYALVRDRLVLESNVIDGSPAPSIPASSTPFDMTHANSTYPSSIRDCSVRISRRDSRLCVRQHSSPAQLLHGPRLSQPTQTATACVHADLQVIPRTSRSHRRYPLVPRRQPAMRCSG